jgi:hypothetical protein
MSDELPSLKEAFAVRNSPFLAKEATIESAATTKRTAEDFINLKNTVRNNPFFEKKAGGYDKNTVSEDNATAAGRNSNVSPAMNPEPKQSDKPGAKLLSFNQKPPFSVKKSLSCEVPSSEITQQEGEDSPKWLDILRNLDSKPKTEKVLFQTDRNGPKTPISQPDAKSTTTSTLKRAGSVSDRRLLFETPKSESLVQTITKSLKNAQDQTPKVETRPIDAETLMSIAERSKMFEEPVETNKLTRSLSIVERKKKFLKKDVKPVVPPTTIHSMRSASKLSKMPSIADEAENESEVAPTKPISSKPIKATQSNISALIHRLQTKKEETSYKPAELVRKSGGAHVILELYQQEGADEGELESKRSDSGAFVDQQSESGVPTRANLAFPKIDIGSIFDEQDSWMNTILASDSLGESAETSLVSEEVIAPEPPILQSEVSLQVHEVAATSTVVENDEIKTMVVAESEPISEKKVSKKSVSFGVAWNGGLAEYRYYAVDPEDDVQSSPRDALGVLLLKSELELMQLHRLKAFHRIAKPFHGP